VSPSPADETIARALPSRVAAVFNAQQAWWFGYRARGEGRADSDFDFLVIAPTALDRLSRVSLALRATVARDMFVVTPDEFEAAKYPCGSIIFSALHEGRTLRV